MIEFREIRSTILCFLLKSGVQHEQYAKECNLAVSGSNNKIRLESLPCYDGRE